MNNTYDLSTIIANLFGKPRPCRVVSNPYDPPVFADEVLLFKEFQPANDRSIVYQGAHVLCVVKKPGDGPIRHSAYLENVPPLTTGANNNEVLLYYHRSIRLLIPVNAILAIIIRFRTIFALFIVTISRHFGFCQACRNHTKNIVAIMQPYFVPYLGYFRLVACGDPEDVREEIIRKSTLEA